MDVNSHYMIEDELRTLGSEQLRREQSLISNDLKSLQKQIGDLAFNNYRTYADAGRTTQYCTEIFTEMKDKLRLVSGEIPELAAELRDFHARTKDVCNELEIVRSACQKDSPVWELLSLPSFVVDYNGAVDKVLVDLGKRPIIVTFFTEPLPPKTD